MRTVPWGASNEDPEQTGHQSVDVIASARAQRPGEYVELKVRRFPACVWCDAIAEPLPEFGQTTYVRFGLNRLKIGRRCVMPFSDNRPHLRDFNFRSRQAADRHFRWIETGVRISTVETLC